MTLPIQLLCNGVAGAVHARWAFDPALGFPGGGFDLYRRRSGGAAGWITLAYEDLPAGVPATALQAAGYQVAWTPSSTTGAATSIMPVNGVRSLVWGSGEVRFPIKPSAPRLAVNVGHLPPGTPGGDAGAGGVTPGAGGPGTVVTTTSGGTLAAGSTTGGAAAGGTTPSGGGATTGSLAGAGAMATARTGITLRASSPSGVETQYVDPPYMVPVRVEFAAADVSDVRIEGLNVFVVSFEILTAGAASSSWGAPLNGATPIRLPRSDTAAHFTADLNARLASAEFGALFGTPTDAAAVEELRQLVDACQPDPNAPPGEQLITRVDADGTETSVDPLGLLLVLALQPIVARALGLYWIDGAVLAGEAYDYRAEGHWDQTSPPWARIGTVAHEFYGSSSGSTRLPAAASSLTASSVALAVPHPLSAPSRPIFVPTNGTDLDWSLPVRVGTDLIDFDAVLYVVERQSLGLLSPPQTAPPSPTPNAWNALNADAPQVIAADEQGATVRPLYSDVPLDIATPFEGWYAYRVKGIGVFGLESGPSPAGTVLQLDDLPPPPPRRLAGPPTGVVIGSDVALSWTWGPGEALSAPDAATFRVYLQERAPTVIDVTTGTATADQATGRATVPLTGGPLPTDAATRLPGNRLEVDGRSYLILSAVAGGAQSVTVALSQSQAPQSGRPGTISYLVPPDAAWTQRVLSAPVVGGTAATLTAAAFSAGRVSVTIAPATARAAASVGAVVYDRTNGFEFVVEMPPDAAGVAVLVPPPDFDASSPLPAGNALVFPRQSTTIVDPFASGASLRYAYFAVSAADARAYAGDRITTGTNANISGNEGSPSVPATVLAFDATPPPTPGAGTSPDGPNVYATPPDFYSRSYYTLRWTPTAGLRTQVFRALDKAIFAADRARGAGRNYQDSQYATLTNRQLADLAGQFDDIFMIRTTVPVAGGSFRDELPGSGPNRFIYRTAVVNDAGVRSSLSPSWAPVWIPDTIPPSTPTPKNSTVSDGLVTLRWTQPNEALVSYYNVYRTTIESNTIDIRLMGTPRAVAAGVMSRSNLAFEYLDSDVADGVRYWYCITAVRQVTQPVTVDLESPSSPAISVKAYTSAPPDTAVITVTTWNPSARTVSLSWTQVPMARAYLQRSFDGMSWRTLAAPDLGATSYVDQLAAESRPVAYYRVKVMTASGRHSVSDPVAVMLP